MNSSQNTKKIALTLMYDGAKFHGWQVQSNAKSVQSTVQDALQMCLGFRPDVCGCSRTDSGVHANEYVCHISSEKVKVHVEKLPAALNFHLKGSGLAVKCAQEKPSDFHARYSCKGKEYIYKIWNAPFENPFLTGKALFYPSPLDVQLLEEICAQFCGTHDFRAFMSKGSKNENNTVRTVKYFTAEKQDNLIILRVCADGFLYNMVRIMVGTVIKCATSKEKTTVKEIIDSLDREQAGDTMPSHALYLNKVFYE